MAVSIKIDAKDTSEKLESLENELPNLLEKALEKACLIVENSAKQYCPVDSGQLRQSIEHEVEGLTGEVGTNVEYAPYIEIGTGIYSTQGNGRQTPWKYQDAKGQWHSTKGMKAQPFLKPALESNFGQIARCFEELL